MYFERKSYRVQDRKRQTNVQAEQVRRRTVAKGESRRWAFSALTWTPPRASSQAHSRPKPRNLLSVFMILSSSSSPCLFRALRPQWAGVSRGAKTCPSSRRGMLFENENRGSCQRTLSSRPRIRTKNLRPKFPLTASIASIGCLPLLLLLSVHQL